MLCALVIDEMFSLDLLALGVFLPIATCFFALHVASEALAVEPTTDNRHYRWASWTMTGLLLALAYGLSATVLFN
jgi:hypothetical protein